MTTYHRPLQLLVMRPPFYRVPIHPGNRLRGSRFGRGPSMSIARSVPPLRREITLPSGQLRSSLRNLATIARAKFTSAGGAGNLSRTSAVSSSRPTNTTMACWCVRPVAISTKCDAPPRSGITNFERAAAWPSLVNAFAKRLLICSRITPQFSGRTLPYEARRERIMKWRARAVAATTCHGPLQLLVSRRLRRPHRQSPANQQTAPNSTNMLGAQLIAPTVAAVASVANREAPTCLANSAAMLDATTTGEAPRSVTTNCTGAKRGGLAAVIPTRTIPTEHVRSTLIRRRPRRNSGSGLQITRPTSKPTNAATAKSIGPSLRRLTPQFSGRVTPCPARRERIMKMTRSRRASDWVSRSAATAC
jgi:hypothetical protein